MQRQTTTDTEQEKTMDKSGKSNIPNQNEIDELIAGADNSDEYGENLIDCSDTEFIDELTISIKIIYVLKSLHT